MRSGTYLMKAADDMMAAVFVSDSICVIIVLHYNLTISTIKCIKVVIYMFFMDLVETHNWVQCHLWTFVGVALMLHLS